MVKAKENRWMLLFISLLLVSFLYWFGPQSKLGETVLLTVLSIGTPAYLYYYLECINQKLLKHYIKVIAIAAGVVICLHALLAIFSIEEGSTIQALTALTYLAVFLLLWLVVMATLKSLYSVVIENPMFSVVTLICGFILVFTLNIPQTIGSAILLAVQNQTISLQWYEPLSLIFLVQISLAAFLLPFQLGAKWIAKDREMILSLSIVIAMAINGMVGALAMFALHFQ